MASNILYMKIVSGIKQKILKGILKPGDILPSETSLIKEYSVTKMTTRKALTLLANEGYIYSVPGKGNFVCEPQTSHFDLYFNKFDKLNIQIDSVELLSVDVDITDPVAYINLQLPIENKLIKIKRLLFSAKKPVAYEIIFMKYKPQDPSVENILKFANYTDKIDQKYPFALEKQIKIECMKASEKKEILDQLLLTNDSVIYKISEIIKNTNENLVVSYSEYYIENKYLTIIATQSY